MANKKISGLSDASELTGDEYLILVQDGANVKVPLKTAQSAVGGKIPIVDCGDFNVSGNVFPTTGGTGEGDAIARGNEFNLIGNGTLGESPIIGTNKMTARALDDIPGQDETKWKIY